MVKRSVSQNLLELQRQARDDPALTDGDRLLFCRLLCDLGFRHGWLYGDASWSPQMADSAARLHDHGYLVLLPGSPCSVRRAAHGRKLRSVPRRCAGRATGPPYPASGE